MCCAVLSSFKLCLTVTLWTIAHQALLSMGFSRQESWSGFQFPSPGDLLNPGIEPISLTSPALAGRFFTTSSNWETQASVSVQFSHSVVSDSLRPHESHHTRPPCPSPTPGVYSNSCPLSQWCHPAISSSAVPFSSCSQSLPALGSFLMSQLFAWGGRSIGVSASVLWPPDVKSWLTGKDPDAEKD